MRAAAPFSSLHSDLNGDANSGHVHNCEGRMRLSGARVLYVVGIDLLGTGSLAYIQERENWPIFLLLLGCVWLVPIGFGAWRLLTFWIGYHLFLKKLMVREYADRFIRAGFPDAGGHVYAYRFLSAVLDDEYLSQRTKLKAAVMVGELKSLGQTAAWTTGVAAVLAFQEAMAQHRNQAWERSAQQV